MAAKAVADLVAELDATRKEHAKIAMRASQLESIVLNLRDQCAAGVAKVATLERRLAATETQHTEDLKAVDELSVAKSDSLISRVQQQQRQIEILEARKDRLIALEHENRELRAAVLDAQSSAETLQVRNAELRHKVESASVAAVEELRENFERKLHEAKEQVRLDAFRALSEESKVALQGHDHLEAVLHRQNESIEMVVTKYKALEKHCASLEADNAALREADVKWREQVQRMEKAVREVDEKRAALEEGERQRRVERASLELLYLEYTKSKKQCRKAQEESRRHCREAERWKKRAFSMAQEMSDAQREAAELKLAQTQLNDSVFSGRTYPSSHMGSPQPHPAAVLEVLDYGATISTAADDAESRPLTADEILAIWNVHHQHARQDSAATGHDGGVPTPRPTTSPPKARPLPTLSPLRPVVGSVDAAVARRNKEMSVLARGSGGRANLLPSELRFVPATGPARTRRRPNDTRLLVPL